MTALVRKSALPACLVLASLFAVAANGGSIAAPDRAGASPADHIRPASHIVQFEEGIDPDLILVQLEQELGTEARFIYRYAINGASLVIPAGRERDVELYPGVRSLESNGGVELTAFPVDQEIQDWMRRSGMTAAHPSADIDGAGPGVDVDIAIIDSGVNGAHPDINLFAAIECIFGRSGENPPVPDGCETHFDLSDIDDTNDDPVASIDSAGHGTRVASVAAAKDNGFGIVGMAPGARIWSARLSGDDTQFGGAASTDQPFTDSFIAALDWVAQHASEIEVANFSLALLSPSQAAHDAVIGVVDLGVTMFAAAGNGLTDVFGGDGVVGTGDDIEPASYPEVATISGYVDTDGMPGGLGPAASNGEADDTYWQVTNPFVFGSNFSATDHASNPVSSPGAAIDFGMPAKDIMSACVQNAPIDTGSQQAECAANDDGQGGNYGRASGTSLASPQAAGLAALIIAKKGTRDLDGDGNLDADDTYALRQVLIDLAIAQGHSTHGLVSPTGDPDTNPDPLGSAGMVLDFGVTEVTLPDTGDTQGITVSVPYFPIKVPGTVQLNLIHDRSRFAIQNVLCSGDFTGGLAFGPVANLDNTGSVFGCVVSSPPASESGDVLTFEISRTGNGGEAFVPDESGSAFDTGFIDSGMFLLNAELPSISIFGADITGSFSLQGAFLPAQLTSIGPTLAAIPATGSSTLDVAGTYDPDTQNFVASVNAPGTYDLFADAGGFIPRRYQAVDVASDGSVTGLPPQTSLSSGDGNGDGNIDALDLSLWLMAFGTSPPDRLDQFGNVVDFNGDGAVTGLDVATLVGNIPLVTGVGFEVWPAP